MQDIKCRTDAAGFHIDRSQDWGGEIDLNLPTSDQLIDNMDDISLSEMLTDNLSYHELANLVKGLYFSDACAMVEFSDKLYRRINDALKGQYDNG